MVAETTRYYCVCSKKFVCKSKKIMSSKICTMRLAPQGQHTGWGDKGCSRKTNVAYFSVKTSGIKLSEDKSMPLRENAISLHVGL